MTAKKLIILQPSYIPWIGYFDQINRADTFVFYDDVQYTRRDWRNRNKIKNSDGKEQLLTIPICSKGKYHGNINEMKIDPARPWPAEHLKKIQLNYAKAPYFKKFFPQIESLIQLKEVNLATYNIETTKKIAALLGIQNTQFAKSSEMKVKYQDSTDHLVQICKKLAATHYLTGDSAKDYMDEAQFSQAGITLEYHNYKHPPYHQLWGDFIPYLSIIDLLFNEGPNSLKILSNSA